MGSLVVTTSIRRESVIYSIMVDSISILIETFMKYTNPSALVFQTNCTSIATVRINVLNVYITNSQLGFNLVNLCT